MTVGAVESNLSHKRDNGEAVRQREEKGEKEQDEADETGERNNGRKDFWTGPEAAIFNVMYVSIHENTRIEVSMELTHTYLPNYAGSTN